MANNINVNNPTALPGSTQRPVSQQSSEADKNVSLHSPKNPTDRVSVTTEASRLREIEEHLMNGPEVNATKVAALRQSIADGTFEINPQRIAEKLLSFEKTN